MNWRNKSIEDLFDSVISWSHEYKDSDNAIDIHYALGQIQEYLDEINQRVTAEICSEEA